MSLMKSRVLPNCHIVLGPCPGCDAWTLEYDHLETVELWYRREFAAIVESALAEHLSECRGLQTIVRALDTP